MSEYKQSFKDIAWRLAVYVEQEMDQRGNQEVVVKVGFMLRLWQEVGL